MSAASGGLLSVGAAQIPGRLHSLDVLRGCAALSVVFWHWQHFFYSGTKRAALVIQDLPLVEVFFLFYSKGWLAVDLFFTLSGFVFYWLYSKGVAERAVGWRDFVVLRLSRLYPLHLLTLLAVLAGQWAFHGTTGTYYVYPFNDAYHFLLNVLFASSWNFERGYSFNAPIWSVSVEVFLYALFFALCRLIPVRLSVLSLVSAAGFLLVSPLYDPIGRGIGSFFLGGCMFLVYAGIVRAGRVAEFCRWSTCLAAVLWVAWIVAVWWEWGMQLGRAPALLLLWRLEPHVRVLQSVLNAWPALLLFPLSILSLALLETRNGSWGRGLSFLGNISYSSYLLHFPLQLAVMTLATSLSRDARLFYSSGSLVLFFLILLTASFASFHCFEVPVQRWLRKRFLTGRPVRGQGSLETGPPSG